jgi:peptidoglycan/xylan/chitin deacetylase (PgdA/CDA1 family)
MLSLVLWPLLAVSTAAGAVFAHRLSRRVVATVLAMMLVACLGIWFAISGTIALLVAIAATGSVVASRLVPGSSLFGWRVAMVAVAGALPGLVCFAYMGATMPQATWFGDAISHGPRSSNVVALTFDDGPNGESTLAVMRVLDSAGVAGTFFEVGKAVEAEPYVTGLLISHGHLIGDHSYSHGRWSFLSPTYPEAAKAQSAIADSAGVCPAFFRPPHGDRTPLMLRAVAGEGLTTVTWDVSAGDWATDNASLIAKRVLQSVKPGSIILLHDGLDGKPGADRSVVAEALPLILDGLKAKGLQPVRLDELLGRPAYQAQC